MSYTETQTCPGCRGTKSVQKAYGLPKPCPRCQGTGVVRFVEIKATR